MNRNYQNSNQDERDHFGLLVALRLSEATDTLPRDVSERLRAARIRAIGNRKLSGQPSMTAVSTGGGTLSFRNENLSAWGRWAAAAPLLLLVSGLIFITIVQNDNRANEIAEVDAALLTDDLPPSAYADPGFTHFLKMRSNESIDRE
jgi:hypothetical protein